MWGRHGFGIRGSSFIGLRYSTSGILILPSLLTFLPKGGPRAGLVSATLLSFLSSASFSATQATPNDRSSEQVGLEATTGS